MVINNYVLSDEPTSQGSSDFKRVVCLAER